MAIERHVPFNTIYEDEEIIIGEYKVNGCYDTLAVSGAGDNRDYYFMLYKEIPFTRITDTQYRPNCSYCKNGDLWALGMLFKYREKLKEITGVDFFAGVHVEDMEQSKAQ